MFCSLFVCVRNLPEPLGCSGSGVCPFDAHVLCDGRFVSSVFRTPPFFASCGRTGGGASSYESRYFPFPRFYSGRQVTQFPCCSQRRLPSFLLFPRPRGTPSNSRSSSSDLCATASLFLRPSRQYARGTWTSRDGSFADEVPNFSISPPPLLPLCDCEILRNASPLSQDPLSNRK